MKTYTKEDTARSILENPAVRKYLHIFTSEQITSAITEEYMDHTLRELEGLLKMPWGGPFISEMLLDGVKRVQELIENNRFTFVPLWTAYREGFIPDLRKQDKSGVCLMRFRDSSGKNGSRRPAALICPGGGYEFLSVQNEGIDYAQRMEEAGYAAFILLYRVAPNHYPEPQKDLALAIKHLRKHAEYYQLDPNRILLMGSSAGGHLCASESAYVKEIDELLMEDLRIHHPDLADAYEGISVRADGVCLSYPVIDFTEYAHEPSFQALTGGEEALRDKLSVQKHLSADFPKTYLWACADDELVPYQNSECMNKALQDKGVPCKWHIFEQGGHGCGLAKGTSAQSWSEEMLAYIGM